VDAPVEATSAALGRMRRIVVGSVYTSRMVTL
jgi:hypothetical protein